MKRIGIGLKKNAYTPEAYAYADFLTKKGWFVQLAEDEALDPNLDLHIYYMGLRPFWSQYCKKKEGKYLEIHEYHSLSTGSFPKVKNLLKKIINVSPNGRIYLNKIIEKEIDYEDQIPSICRDMGVSSTFFSQPPISPQFDLVYCGSIAGRPGLQEVILNLLKKGLTILVIGTVTPDFANLFQSYKNIKFSGRVSRDEIPHLLSMARAGLNYTPDIYPLNIQTSTKTLEYLAAGLGLVSNKYEWINLFSLKMGYEPLWINDLLERKSFDDKKFKNVDVSQYEWDILLEKSGLFEFLNNIIESK